MNDMNMDLYFNIENEKPLDNLAVNGGMCGIFRTIGCVGDSLSSGEFESFSEEGIVGWHDFYEYSWGQFMARDIGTKVYNFSRGGMTAKAFMESFGAQCGAWDNPCQAYILALGVNDISAVIRGDIELGTSEDIGNPPNDSFAGAYTNIILTLKRHQPKAKFFLMTLPQSNNDEVRSKLEERHAEIMYEIAEKYQNCYVLDFRKYAPVYDEKFKEAFYLAGHLNPMGYRLTATMVESYIDYIIRHNPEDFKQVGFVGTPYYNCNEKW